MLRAALVVPAFLLLCRRGAEGQRAREGCTDAGMGAASKYSCVDYACMNLCHMSHVRKNCRRTCGACDPEGVQETIGLPPAPEAPKIVARKSAGATIGWQLPASVCPVKTAELTFSPPVRGRASYLVSQGKKVPSEYAVVGMLADIEYTVTIRVKSSFGWSLSLIHI